jgi:hypothetical protein
MPLDDTASEIKGNDAEYGNHIPAAVRRQAERAEALARQFSAPADGEETIVEPVAEVPSNTTVVEPVAAPAPAPVVNEPDYKQMYLSLQGKYDAEIPTLHNQVASMERLVATMSAPRAEPTPVPELTPPSGATPKDIEDFGQELIDAAVRWVAPLVHKLEGRITQLEGQLGTVRSSQEKSTTMTARQTGMLSLDNDAELGVAANMTGRKSKDGRSELWRVVNDDQEFVAWLNHADVISGQQRLKLLRDAFDAGNAVRMKALFKAFIAEHTAVNTPSPTPSTQTPTGADATSLEAFVAPGRTSGPGPVGASREKRMWTQTDISRFYRDVTQGKYRDDPARKLAIEQDIHAAMAEGRIR